MVVLTPISLAIHCVRHINEGDNHKISREIDNTVFILNHATGMETVLCLQDKQGDVFSGRQGINGVMSGATNNDAVSETQL